jgi:hypothetical protein
MTHELYLVVELDPFMEDISRRFFGFRPQQDRLQVVIGDGLEWVKQRAASTAAPAALLGALVLDVDAKNGVTSGFSCPPLPFLSRAFLS